MKSEHHILVWKAFRQKLVKLADKSEFGWATVQEYVCDDLPTMKWTPQKSKRLRKEPQPSLKHCKRKRRNLALNFRFPRLRRITLLDLVVRPVLFLLLVVIFVPKVGASGNIFKGADLCFRCGKRGHWATSCPSKDKISLSVSKS